MLSGPGPTNPIKKDLPPSRSTTIEEVPRIPITPTGVLILNCGRFNADDRPETNLKEPRNMLATISPDPLLGSYTKRSIVRELLGPRVRAVSSTSSACMRAAAPVTKVSFVRITSPERTASGAGRSLPWIFASPFTPAATPAWTA